MALTSQSERFIALKKLFGKIHSGNTKQPANESVASQISISANQIIGQEINSAPATAVSDGIVEVLEIDLVLDATSNGKSYRGYFPAGYSGFFGGGVASTPVGDTTFVVPFFFNSSGVLLNNLGGYSPRLFDNSSEIFATDSSDWFFDPFASVVTSEDDLNLGSTGTMYVYLYIGDTIQDHISNESNPHNVTARQVGGIVEWQVSTNYTVSDLVFIDKDSSYGDVSFMNGIYVCTSSHTSHASDFTSDSANWKILNSGYEHAQGIASTDWQIDHNLGRFPSVMVTDSTDTEIMVEVEHTTINQLFIRSNSAITGKVYCT